ncbi:MAG: hypothetical protein NTY53_21220 [Kiritimatiellaeota bacterium]|nr:hypothetical protein [Kiritimatiellota bacterium]
MSTSSCGGQSLVATGAAAVTGALLFVAAAVVAGALVLPAPATTLIRFHGTAWPSVMMNSSRSRKPESRKLSTALMIAGCNCEEPLPGRRFLTSVVILSSSA